MADLIFKTDKEYIHSVKNNAAANALYTVKLRDYISSRNHAEDLQDNPYSKLCFSDSYISDWSHCSGLEASTDDGYWVHTLLMVHEELEVLGLSKPTPKPEPKKRGRKPKPKDLTSQKPKRPGGRPSKKQNSSADNL